MPFRAVLDANVLYPFSLRDTLLRLAEPQPTPAPAPLYMPLWSDRILEEMVRNLVEDKRMDHGRADRLVSLMRSAFEGASVSEKAIAGLVDSMTNDPGDRHVLAAAVAGGAEAIFTFNLEHFRRTHASRSESRRPTPTSFSSMFEQAPELVVAEVHRQAGDLINPLWSVHELLGALERAGVAEFAATLRDAVDQRLSPGRKRATPHAEHST